MKKVKTNYNWWLTILAFVAGLIIGTFIFGNLFGINLSLTPFDFEDENIMNCVPNGNSCENGGDCCSGSCNNGVCLDNLAEHITTILGPSKYICSSLSCPETVTHLDENGNIVAEWCLSYGTTLEIGCGLTGTGKCYYHDCSKINPGGSDAGSTDVTGTDFSAN